MKPHNRRSILDELHIVATKTNKNVLIEQRASAPFHAMKRFREFLESTVESEEDKDEIIRKLLLAMKNDDFDKFVRYSKKQGKNRDED